MNNKEWKRKNPIFKELREKLHNFRADDVQVEITAETAGTYDNHQLTGQEIVTIKMIGKFKNVRLPIVDGVDVVFRSFPTPTAARAALRESNRIIRETVKKEEVARRAALALVENKETGEGNDGQT